MKFIELFAGIGGFRNGLESVEPQKFQGEKLCNRGNSNSIESAKRKQSDFTCVYANEFDKYAAQIYEKNYGERRITEKCNTDGRTKPDTNGGDGSGGRTHTDCVDTRDIRTVKAEEIPDHDLLTAGFPCQSFSIAGKRKGFDDTRGTLFFDIARILKAKNPRLLFLENVKGLLSHDSGSTFKTIISTLTELGYDLQWQVLNSKNFGVPQNRERVFIIGHIRGTSRPQVFPIGVRNEQNEIKRLGHMEGFRRYNQTYDETGVVEALDTSGGGGHQPCVISKTVRAGGRKSPHGSKQNWDSYEVGGRIRRLTPTECERLQGFPDGWTEGVSDTQRYKCLGNAVTTNVVTAIGKEIARSDY